MELSKSRGKFSHDRNIQVHWWWALGPPRARLLPLSRGCCEYSENLTNITAALTTPPSQIHNGSRSRSPRGYALCVSAIHAIMCATSTDGMQLLKGLQEEGNGTKLPNRQKTQWVLIFAQIPLSTYLKQYKVGDIVDVVANGTQPRK
jgi:hypothetical protein